MEDLLRSLGRIAGIIVDMKRFVEESIRITLFDIVKSVGGDVLLRAIYSFPQPNNNILKEMQSLGFDSGTLHEICGKNVTIDCLFRIIDVLQKDRFGR